MDLDIRLVRKLMRATDKKPMRVFMIFCARWLIYAFLPLVVLSDLFFCGNFPRALSWNSGMSVAFAFLITLLLGAIMYRARPFVGHTAFIRARIRPPLTIHSFPSSHASSAFALATSLAQVHPFLGLVGFVMASLISVARISVGVHYLTDILVGALIGVLSSVAFHAYGDRIIACVL